MSNKLLLLTSDNERYLQLLEEQNLPELDIAGDTPDHIARTNIWLADPPLAAPLLGLGKNLKWLQSTYAGVDKLLSTQQRTDYLLTNVREMFGPMMSEYVFGYLIAHFRNHHAYRDLQKQKIWQAQPDQQLRNKRILIIGTGSIGQHLAKTAKMFAMQTIGISRSGENKPAFDDCYNVTALAQELPLADIIVSVLPSSPQTHRILDKSQLSRLKSDAIFFNVGRGNAVDLVALNEQLKAQPRMRAVLDVFDVEPLIKTDDIWQRENVIITPHVAAPSSPEQVINIFAENYRRWLKGIDIKYQIDFKLGY